MQTSKDPVNRACLLTATVALVCLAFVPGQVSGLADSPAFRIVIRGSSTLLPVAEIWVEDFQQSSNGSEFDIKANGSSEGIRDLLAGRTDIAMASRPITSDEYAGGSHAGLTIRETVVARMGIAVVVHRDNPVSSISVNDLARVFSGTFSNWQEIGGPDEIITVVRKTSGWSPEFFRRRIMGNSEYVSEGVIVDSKEAIVAEVGRQKWSIGITGMPDAIPALDEIRLVRMTSESSAEDATYALSRRLYFYTTGDSPALQSFLAYVLSKRAQDLIVEVGLYPAHQTDMTAPE